MTAFNGFFITKPIGTFAQRVSVLYGRLSNTLSELFRDCQIIFRRFLYPLSPAQRLSEKICGNVHPFSLKHCISVKIFKKLKTHFRILKPPVAFLLIIFYLNIPLLAKITLLQHPLYIWSSRAFHIQDGNKYCRGICEQFISVIFIFPIIISLRETTRRILQSTAA